MEQNNLPAQEYKKGILEGIRLSMGVLPAGSKLDTSGWTTYRLAALAELEALERKWGTL